MSLAKSTWLQVWSRGIVVCDMSCFIHIDCQCKSKWERPQRTVTENTEEAGSYERWTLVGGPFDSFASSYLLFSLLWCCQKWLDLWFWFSYLFDELCKVADIEARQQLLSAWSSSLIVSRIRLCTVGDWAFPVAAARIWILEQFISALHFCTFIACLPVTPQDSSLHHFISQSVTMYSARAVTLVIWDTCSCHLLIYFVRNIKLNVKELQHRRC